MALQWFFMLVEMLAITLRLYSRTFITRSVWSDDFFIAIGFVRFILLTTLSNNQLTIDSRQ